jgi:8-oxo-dGTP pyrophosphatase MutT (NUDIX family)
MKDLVTFERAPVVLPSQPNPWRTVSSELRYQNPWISVREDQVIRPDGKPGIYGVVESKVAIGVVAITAAEEVLLVGQYRYPTKCYSWEIIEGGAEHGEAPEVAAARELREEAGVRARTWRSLGEELHLSNCFSAEVARLYIATDLEEVGAEPDPTESLLIQAVPLPQVFGLVDSGAIKDALSVIGLLRYARILKQ